MCVRIVKQLGEFLMLIQDAEVERWPAERCGVMEMVWSRVLGGVNRGSDVAAEAGGAGEIIRPQGFGAPDQLLDCALWRHRHSRADSAPLSTGCRF